MTRGVGPSPMSTMPGRPSARKTIAASTMSLGRVPRAPSMATGSCPAYQPRLPSPVRVAPAAPGCPSSARYIAVLPRRFMTTTAASRAAAMRHEHAVPEPEPAEEGADADDDGGRERTRRPPSTTRSWGRAGGSRCRPGGSARCGRSWLRAGRTREVELLDQWGRARGMPRAEVIRIRCAPRGPPTTPPPGGPGRPPRPRGATGARGSGGPSGSSRWPRAARRGTSCAPAGRP